MPVPITIGGTVLSFLLSLSSVHAQNLEASNNVTALYGTWSSGSGGVTTGSGFANPLAYSFNYPATSGIAYSFDNEGHFEEAQYRFNSNASLPNCIQTVVIWQHGTYTLNTNGSLTLTPFAGDGRIQVQDPCAAVTNVITVYEQKTYYSHWDIIVDTVPNNYMLELAKFDGSAMPGLYLQARPPNMLPTIQLSDQAVTTTTSTAAASATKRSLLSNWF
ncbi:Chaperone, endoplasmic reticulum protein-folding, fungi [Phaffia rhodozyma]|uniref:Protein ROT1 n=1 Tax=Phaffia rhodozyma TaxID=264483 RepID=A0A0F7SK69_PHARH|nr:Chaperone, endoplasmic reticulum protein-folding, fungi [Phaffia rhodozyma]